MAVRHSDTHHAVDSVRLFVYGSLLAGERDHALLHGAEFLGEARTAAAYTLVELTLYPALVFGGQVSIVGELYRIDKKARFAIDVARGCPALFQRARVTLDDGSDAEAYVMRDEQVRGKRRLKGGSWRGRFTPEPRKHPVGPMTEFTRRRFGPR